MNEDTDKDGSIKVTKSDTLYTVSVKKDQLKTQDDENRFLIDIKYDVSPEIHSLTKTRILTLITK
ncbi:MAG: hypothetical protein IJ645_04445 [Ruminococcus sp.]|nr:hypothetical protein [Ruminococcus sp.]